MASHVRTDLCPTYVIPDAADRGLDAPLFTPGHVAAATFLCGPLAGFTLIATNFKRLMDSTAAVGSVAAGIAATVLLWATGYYDPIHFFSLKGLAVASVMAFFLGLLADTVQGPDLRAHAIAGGERATPCKALALALPVAVVQMALIVALRWATFSASL